MTDQLCNKGQNFQQNEVQHTIFDRLKLAISIFPILLVVDPTKPLIVKTYARATIEELFYSKTIVPLLLKARS